MPPVVGGAWAARGRAAACAALVVGMCGCSGVHVRKASSGWLIVPARPCETFVLPETVVYLADREDVQAAWDRTGDRPLAVSGVTVGDEMWVERDPANPELPIMSVMGHEACHRVKELDARMPCSSAYRGTVEAVDAEAWE
jgi:hypothetical protein